MSSVLAIILGFTPKPNSSPPAGTLFTVSCERACTGSQTTWHLQAGQQDTQILILIIGL